MLLGRITALSEVFGQSGWMSCDPTVLLRLAIGQGPLVPIGQGPHRVLSPMCRYGSLPDTPMVLFSAHRLHYVPVCLSDGNRGFC
jgi:hypothetical protein